MADKRTKLEIVIAAVDKATAGLRAVNDRIKAIGTAATVLSGPVMLVGEKIAGLAREAGLPKVIDGFKGVGGAVVDLLGKVAIAGGVLGAATAGLMSLIDGFDDLGDKAERIGVTVDALAQLRYAAQRSGASADALDNSMGRLTAALGEARAGGGPLVEFLNKVSPALLRQLKATKSTEEAFGLLADAMAKLPDPARRAALAQKTIGDPTLAPLLAKGAKGIQELRDEYAASAGSQEGAAAAAGDFGDAMDKLKAATDGIKAALVVGLAPALKGVIERLRVFLGDNRERIAAWAQDLGKRIPGAVAALVDGIRSVIGIVRPFVDSATKLKVIAVALAAVIAGPLVSAVVSLGVALLTTPVGWIVAGIAAIAAGAYLIIDNWDSIAEFFSNLWTAVTRAFGAAWDVIAGGVVAGLSAAAGLVMKVWQPVKDFFVTLWSGVTAAFQTAWEVIGAIVDKVRGAVDTVVGAVETVTDAVGSAVDTVGDAIDFINPFSDSGPSGPSMLDRLNENVQTALRASPAAAPQQARVVVDFANAPRGTRVNADPQSTAAVDLSVGYQMLSGSL